MKILLTIFLTLISRAYAAECSTSDTHCQKAAQLVDILGYKDAVASLRDSCLEQAKVFSPDILVEKDPQLFGNLSSSSPKWPEVLHAFNDYKRSNCGESLDSLLLEAYRDAWSKNLSAEELQSVIDFLKSSRGRNFGLAFPHIYKTVIAKIMPTLNEAGQQAYLHYAKRIRDIAGP